MPVTKLRAFISSTSDLIEEREALEGALPLSFEAYRYERDRARKRSPREHLEIILRDTDVFIGVLGRRYGSVYPDCEGDPSIVEWEFDTARAQEHTELMGFKKQMADAEIEPAQRRFLDELSHFLGGSWLLDFRSTSELTAQVKDSLLEWLAEYKVAEIEREQRQSLPVLPLLTAILTVCAAWTAVANREDFTTFALAGASVVAGAVLGGSLISLLSWWRKSR